MFQARSHVGTATRLCGRGRVVEAASVVFDAKNQMPVLLGDAQRDLAGRAMLDGVVDRLLGGGEQVVSLDGVERGRRQGGRQIQPAAHPRQFEIVLRELAQIAGELFQRVTAGVTQAENGVCSRYV